MLLDRSILALTLAMSTVGVVNHHELNMAPNEKQGVAITERNTTGPPSRDAP